MDGPSGPTGPTDYYMMMMMMGASGPTGPTGPTYIATIDELVTQQSTALAQESADRTSLLPLSNPGSFGFIQPLRQWAAAGFPALTSLISITLNPPSPCSDGTTRTVYEYVAYLLGGKDVAAATVELDSKFLGITISYVLSGNTLQLCATRE
jgi:hypothetical protein